MNCWLAQFSDKPCDGRLVRCHLLPQQLINRTVKSANPGVHKKALIDLLAVAIRDPRGWVWGCGGLHGNAGHHGMLDQSRTLRVPYEALPPELLEFASELGVTWWLDREYRQVAA
jgi:hypothetical protein